MNGPSHWKSATLWGSHGLAASLGPIAYDHANPLALRCWAVIGMIVLPIAHHAMHLAGQLIDWPAALGRIGRMLWDRLQSRRRK